MPFKLIPTALALVAATFLLSACSKPAPPEAPIRSVKVLTVGVDNMHSGAEFAGEVRARVESRLGFRVAGKMVRRQADLGQRVKAGDVLAQLDPQDYQLAAQAGQAQVVAALTNRDLAAADYKRFKERGTRISSAVPSWSAAMPRSRPRRRNWTRPRPSPGGRATRRPIRH